MFTFVGSRGKSVKNTFYFYCESTFESQYFLLLLELLF